MELNKDWHTARDDVQLFLRYRVIRSIIHAQPDLDWHVYWPFFVEIAAADWLLLDWELNRVSKATMELEEKEKRR